MRTLLLLATVGCALWTLAAADFKPCLGLALLNEDCDKDTDCGERGTYCHLGKCDCHPAYELVKETDQNGAETVRCAKLPDKYDQECDKKCAEPLYCENQKCTCKYSKRSGDTCMLENGIGDRCSKHTDCTEPFTACVGQKCICIKGTTNWLNRECRAEKQCPLGGKAGKSCQIAASADDSIYANAASSRQNNSLVMDDCAEGQYCVTAEGSLSGHCCELVRASCPLSTKVSTEYSCEGGAPNFCPSKTHFCHKVSGNNFGFSVCCLRPCQQSSGELQYDVKNLQCSPVGHLESPCATDEDCDGGATMTCQSRRCTCKPDFKPKRDSLTDATGNPAQRCERVCAADAARDTECYSQEAPLGGPCFIQEQCPTGSACFRGRCECRCGYEVQFGRCVAPTTTTTTTARPRTRVPGGVTVPGSTGTGGAKPVAPNIGDLFNIFNGGGSGGGGGLGGAGGGGIQGLLSQFIPPNLAGGLGQG